VQIDNGEMEQQSSDFSKEFDQNAEEASTEADFLCPLGGPEAEFRV
jgi:hypothetical protein